MLRKSGMFDPMQPVRYRFETGSYNIPQPQKAYRGGQDAFVVEPHLIVVADGVGGWANMGVDSGIYSRKLCEIIRDMFYSNQTFYTNDPKRLLTDSVRMNNEAGTTTVTVMTLEPLTGIVRCAYIGDSLYGLYRQSPMSGYVQEYVSQEQQKEFNKPYQVGYQGDDPQYSIMHIHQLMAGDIIIVGSDGLWDNLHQKDVETCVNQYASYPQALAQWLGTCSYNCSQNQQYYSPFWDKARRYGYNLPPSGKTDDITIVAAMIVQDHY